MAYATFAVVLTLLLLSYFGFVITAVALLVTWLALSLLIKRLGDPDDALTIERKSPTR